jgi:hypothetical protein
MKRYNISLIVFLLCLTHIMGLSAFYAARIKNSTEVPANITLVRAACDDKLEVVNPLASVIQGHFMTCNKTKLFSPSRLYQIL